MADFIRILHLSDLHLDVASLRDQKVVLRALFSDIKGQVDKDGPFDLVFFTGDLIAKGAYSEPNVLAVETEFLVPLFDAASIDPERFFMVPGNHDVNLKSQSSIIASAQKSLTSEEEVAKYLSDVIRQPQETGLEDFNKVLNRTNASACFSNSHYRSYILTVRGVKVGIGALNSAWHATGAPLDGDYGRLLISRMQMDEVAESLRDAALKIALVHHPLAWLAPKDSQNTHRQLLVNFDALFFGHNHEPDAQVLLGSSNAYFTSNAGCLYQHRDYFNGYCSVQYFPSERKWVVRAREYFEARQEFDSATRFNTGGVAEFVRSEGGGVAAVPQMPSDEFIESSAAAFNSRLLPVLVSDVAPQSLKSIFVDPLLSRVSPRKLGAGVKNGQSGIFVPLKEVLQLKKNIAIVGGSDMGKTTLLQRICALCFEFSGELPAFSAYVDLRVAGETPASLIDAIIAFTGGAYRKAEVIALMKSGAFCICFDNLNEGRSKQFRAVSELCETYERCRFVWSYLEDVEYSLSPGRVPLPLNGAEIFYLHPFGRKETRLLTQNWFGESADECAGKVDEVLSLLGRLNIPRSPFLISALLWIRERQTQFSPVNQAEILDALVDGVMEKLSETKDRSKIDSTIKRHYLAALAEYLHVRGSKRISSMDLEKFTVDYFASKSLPFTAAPFLDELKSKGILLEIGDEVTFMFEAIRAFFLSTRLHENKDLLNKALSKDYFLEFGEELDYYTGRHRDQAEVLRQALSLVSSFRSEANLGESLTRFDSIRSVVGPLSRESASQLRLAAKARPSSDERHAILDSFDARSRIEVVDGDFNRERNTRTAVGRYLEALRIGSSILRNSELVGEDGLKEFGYDSLTEGWCQMLIGVMAALESDGESIFGDPVGDPILGVLEELLPNDNPGMAKYLRNLIVPNVIFSIVLESMGTAKLQYVMERHYGMRKSTIQNILDVFMMVDLRLPKWVDHFDGLLKNHHKNRYVCELIFTKLFQIFMLGRLRPIEEEKVKAMLAESIALMTSVRQERVKTRMKGNFLRNLEKRRLFRR